MSDRRRVRPVVLAALLLFGFWVALSQKLDAFHLTIGLISASAIAFATRGLYRSFPRPMPPGDFARIPLKWHHLLGYGGWLAVQILRAAGDVARVVLGRRLLIAPLIVRLRDDLPHPIARLTLAHSITLTPGTLTIDCDDEGLDVHLLDEATALSFAGDGGPIVRRVRKLFKILTLPR